MYDKEFETFKLWDGDIPYYIGGEEPSLTYYKTTEKLNEYFSEYALIKYRVLVEIKWLLEINGIINIGLIEEEIKNLNSIIKKILLYIIFRS